MHEASIMQEVFALAFAQLRASPASRITRLRRLRLRVGALSGVVPEALSFAFDAMKAGTPAADATLEIEATPLRLACQHCALEFEPVDYPAPCPACAGWKVAIRRGQELDLLSIELSEE
jgi:hydrogenase nickel incorporation protein HypA/HybF